MRSLVASRILARIEEVRVRAGDPVVVGDVLAVLDSRDLQSRVAQAAEALEASRARLDLAQSEKARYEQLFERGVTTRQRLDQAFADLKTAQADVDRLEQSRREAETGLSYTEIRAPVSGLVVDRLAEPGDTASPGSALLRIYDPSALRVEVPSASRSRYGFASRAQPNHQDVTAGPRRITHLVHLHSSRIWAHHGAHSRDLPLRQARRPHVRSSSNRKYDGVPETRETGRPRGQRPDGAGWALSDEPARSGNAVHCRAGRRFRRPGLPDRGRQARSRRRSFSRTTPAKNPRTECDGQPVDSDMSKLLSMVAAQQRAAQPKPRGGPIALAGRRLRASAFLIFRRSLWAKGLRRPTCGFTMQRL
jgi:biotin carboxyl carrier protein